MFTTIFRIICTVLIVVGLAWIYTLFYGGPFGPFFLWLDQHLPHAMQINVTPAPLNH
jgi:hypothetical protein